MTNQLSHSDWEKSIDIVLPIKLAEQLQKLGFSNPCMCEYDHNGHLWPSSSMLIEEERLLAPVFSEARAYLYTKYGYNIAIMWQVKNVCKYCIFLTHKKRLLSFKSEGFMNYIDAMEKSIKHTIELINSTKQIIY